MAVGGAFAVALVQTILLILSIVQWLVLIWVILSWVVFFTSNSSFRWRYKGAYGILLQLNAFLARAASPLLWPFRKVLPPWKTGGIDWSPLLLLITIYFLRIFIVRVWVALA
jgi:YggT family protein